MLRGVAKACLNFFLQPDGPFSKQIASTRYMSPAPSSVQESCRVISQEFQSHGNMFMRVQLHASRVNEREWTGSFAKP